MFPVSISDICKWKFYYIDYCDFSVMISLVWHYGGSRGKNVLWCSRLTKKKRNNIASPLHFFIIIKLIVKIIFWQKGERRRGITSFIQIRWQHRFNNKICWYIVETILWTSVYFREYTYKRGKELNCKKGGKCLLCIQSYIPEKVWILKKCKIVLHLTLYIYYIYVFFVNHEIFNLRWNSIRVKWREKKMINFVKILIIIVNNLTTIVKN